jgi:hypothetical protein
VITHALVAALSAPADGAVVVVVAVVGPPFAAGEWPTMVVAVTAASGESVVVVGVEAEACTGLELVIAVSRAGGVESLADVSSEIACRVAMPAG